MAEGDKHPDKRESLITLSEGTRAYLMPEFGWIDEGGYAQTPTLSQFQSGLNNFFSEIERQGGQIVGILEQEVHYDKDLYQNGRRLENRLEGNGGVMKFVVVKK